MVSLWLRPERALWDAHELAAVVQLLGPAFARPALEYGCTDGINTFVMLGGKVGFDFDDYADLLEGQSITPHKRDYFETTGTNVPTPRADETTQRFDVGISWKQSHIEKAARLEIYDKLSVAELGHPIIGYTDGSFETIWSPNLYWNMPDALQAILADHVRLLSSTGRLVTILPIADQADSEFWSKMHFMPSDWFREMDRGIADNLTRNAKSDAEWRDVFRTVGLKVSRHEPFLPEMVGSVYQIGLRPMFPALMEAYKILKTENLQGWREFKQHWIETASHFLLPLCDVSPSTLPGHRPLWHVYELRRVR